MLATTARRSGTTAKGGAAPGFDARQGPKKNQIQWTVLDSPGRKATPVFRGKSGRAAVDPSRNQIPRRGFDSRRLHFAVASVHLVARHPRGAQTASEALSNRAWASWVLAATVLEADATGAVPPQRCTD